jgi:uroporphyrin-III C-methyltransferase
MQKHMYEDGRDPQKTRGIVQNAVFREHTVVSKAVEAPSDMKAFAAALREDLPQNAAPARRSRTLKELASQLWAVNPALRLQSSLQRQHALPRAVTHLSASSDPDDLQNVAHLEEVFRTLHSPTVAAEAQQNRLRKGDTVDAIDPGVTADAYEPNTVYLVGVGPGDIELLTVKALRLMQTADLVLYDRLISPEVLKLIRPGASMLYVGKEAGLHTRPQDEIHELLLHYASSGKRILRLKGGDPTVFGRGGEEMEYLRSRGVRVRIVPGITAAAGISAGLGVPLTHRDHANSVRFITGHFRKECEGPFADQYPWEQLADQDTTLVIYMGLGSLPNVTTCLMAAGLPRSTPAVAVQDGTTPTQRVVTAPVHELSEAVVDAGLRSPTLVVIGSVVSLLDQEAANATAAVAALAGSDTSPFSIMIDPVYASSKGAIDLRSAYATSGASNHQQNGDMVDKASDGLRKSTVEGGVAA